MDPIRRDSDPRPTPPPSGRPDEFKLCGLAAVRARFQRNPASILRLYFDYATGRKIGPMCKALAAARKIYRCIEPEELAKVAGTIHHGGVVAVVPAVRPAPVAPGETAAWARAGEPLLVLDRIGNAHNLGAIARTAAFFGLPRIVISRDPEAAQPNDAAFRVAEGGLESIEVRIIPSLPPFLKELAAAGYAVVGTAVRPDQGKSPRKLDVMRKGGSRRLVAIVLGNEERGLAPEVAAACSELVRIPGGENVESLNVSAAAAVLIWDLIGHRVPAPKPAGPAEGGVPGKFGRPEKG